VKPMAPGSIFHHISFQSLFILQSLLLVFIIKIPKIDPGAIGFTSGFSQDSISITVGEQITVEQLIEKCIVLRISRHDHVYRHHVRDK